MEIHPFLANVACISYTIVYVGALYVLCPKKLASLPRDHPSVMASRIKAVSLASCLTCLTIYALVIPHIPVTQQIDRFKTILGLRWSVHELYAVLSPLLLVIFLFLGPLSIMYFEKVLPFQANFSFQHDVKDVFFSLLGQRNYVVGPITEEIVFRACMLATLYHANFSKGYLIFASPLYFGLAHIHHAVETYRQMGGTRKALQQAIIMSAFQFAYTTIFGWYVSFIFLRTGNLVSPIVCHVFCNIMGFPDLSGMHMLKPVQQKVIWVCFIVGIVLFGALLIPMTNPSVVGDSMYWS
ncbi:uncharacterized protein BYT42DRAFT_326952 [Radiomyces spectabilis]|uniref:uncharacterized protein n=1 Tax=Radiomyces spectabilis TaxID=64574 RepID=UPI00221FA37C|nr:uncharacterized protein BYT42DRAFT_326952 [Radiomyces spectabilis]KAI8379439.1 hypothetical protein BYT42DRAFT_326952 [Radiomyces spectabilis]